LLEIAEEDSHIETVRRDGRLVTVRPASCARSRGQMRGADRLIRPPHPPLSSDPSIRG
jgi:hypothetical protein